MHEDDITKLLLNVKYSTVYLLLLQVKCKETNPSTKSTIQVVGYDNTCRINQNTYKTNSNGGLKDQ